MNEGRLSPSTCSRGFLPPVWCAVRNRGYEKKATPIFLCNYTGSRSLSLSKAEAGGANRFGFGRLSRRYIQLLTVTFLLTFLFTLLVACQNEDQLPTAVPTAAVSTADEATMPVGEVEVETAVPDDTTPEATATAIPPTATPMPAKTVTICLGGEPSSLFLYGDDSLAATAVRHALYENLFTTLNYDYQPQGLQKLPSLAEGDARIGLVEVSEGDLIVNSAGNVVFLVPSVQFVRGDGEFVTFDRTLVGEGSEPLLMQQMTADFSFRPMVWSDGTNVTAADSVFSYEIAASPDTPDDKSKIERTASYEATGELT
ncbi:hypothetical protein MNBD_CHLOROFLEXI01-629, partial [hydrothermal vent metagenome]